jgi:hypothetical protein
VKVLKDLGLARLCSVIFPVIREFGSLQSYHVIENFRKYSTRLVVDRSARCLLEPSDALPLLEIVPGRYQYAARFLTEHPQMHQRFGVELARREPPKLINVTPLFDEEA